MSVSLSTQVTDSAIASAPIPKPKPVEVIPTRVDMNKIKPHPTFSMRGIDRQFGSMSVSSVGMQILHEREDLRWMREIIEAKKDHEKKGKEFAILVDKTNCQIFFAKNSRYFIATPKEKNVETNEDVPSFGILNLILRHCHAIDISIEEGPIVQMQEPQQPVIQDTHETKEAHETKTSPVDDDDEDDDHVLEMAEEWRRENPDATELCPRTDLQTKWGNLTRQDQEALEAFCVKENLDLDML